MYILIQWSQKPHQVTVMEEPNYLKTFNEGDIVNINYPNKGSFKGRLLCRSESKAFLEELSHNVDKEGNIQGKVTKKKVNKVAQKKSKEQRAEEALKKRIRKKETKSLEKEIAQIDAVYDKSKEESKSDSTKGYEKEKEGEHDKICEKKNQTTKRKLKELNIENVQRKILQKKNGEENKKNQNTAKRNITNKTDLDTELINAGRMENEEINHVIGYESDDESLHCESLYPYEMNKSDKRGEKISDSEENYNEKLVKQGHKQCEKNKLIAEDNKKDLKRTNIQREKRLKKRSQEEIDKQNKALKNIRNKKDLNIDSFKDERRTENSKGNIQENKKQNEEECINKTCNKEGQITNSKENDFKAMNVQRKTMKKRENSDQENQKKQNTTAPKMYQDIENHDIISSIDSELDTASLGNVSFSSEEMMNLGKNQWPFSVKRRKRIIESDEDHDKKMEKEGTERTKNNNPIDKDNEKKWKHGSIRKKVIPKKPEEKSQEELKKPYKSALKIIKKNELGSQLLVDQRENKVSKKSSKNNEGESNKPCDNNKHIIKDKKKDSNVQGKITTKKLENYPRKQDEHKKILKQINSKNDLESELLNDSEEQEIVDPNDCELKDTGSSDSMSHSVYQKNNDAQDDQQILFDKLLQDISSFVTPEVVVFCEQLAIAVKKIYGTTKSPNLMEIKSFENQYDSSKTQLVSDVNVYIDSVKLMLLKRHRHNPRELTRQLLLEIIGAEKLKTMTALGTRGQNGIPANVRCAVYKYVKKTNKDFTESQFIRTINYQCGTLRKPNTLRKKKKASADDKTLGDQNDSNYKDEENEGSTNTENESEQNEDNWSDISDEENAEISKAKKRKHN